MLDSEKVRVLGVVRVEEAEVTLTAKPLLIIKKASIVYGSTAGIVGKPVDFEEYKRKNLISSDYGNEIPTSSWNANASVPG